MVFVIGLLFASSNFNVFNTHLSSLMLYYCFLLTQTNRETQTPPSPFEVYYKLHYNAKKGWLNDEAKIEYVSSYSLCLKLVLMLYNLAEFFNFGLLVSAYNTFTFKEFNTIILDRLGCF
ncbi:hypothetical protein Hanom_Chr02g00174001 [Helianthus anomalus]